MILWWCCCAFYLTQLCIYISLINYYWNWYLLQQHIADNNNYHLLSIYYAKVHVLSPLFIEPCAETLLSTTEDHPALPRNQNRSCQDLYPTCAVYHIYAFIDLCPNIIHCDWSNLFICDKIALVNCKSHIFLI